MKKETCNYCGGIGRVVSCPEYTPFDTRSCYKCNGKGHIMVEGTGLTKEKSAKEKLKDAIKNDPFNVW